ncbi:hypothetical protein D3C87_130140 [compost metagenome]
MHQERLKRIKQFTEFQNATSNFFEEKNKVDGPYKKFDDFYMLTVCPKGRNGGVYNRLYEVFYGARSYGEEMEETEDGPPIRKLLTETGCTLAFGLNDHGYIAVMLHPGKTKYTRQEESTIFIENYLDPTKLSNKRFLNRMWRFFNSYMEKTSVDGNPTRTDKLRVWYLRNFKNKIIDGKFVQRPINSWLKWLGNYILTVALSGSIIYLLTVKPWKNNENETNKIEIENLKIENKELKMKAHYQSIIDSLRRQSTQK